MVSAGVIGCSIIKCVIEINDLRSSTAKYRLETFLKIGGDDHCGMIASRIIVES